MISTLLSAASSAYEPYACEEEAETLCLSRNSRAREAEVEDAAAVTICLTSETPREVGGRRISWVNSFDC
jgi:hypothetical protein